MIKKISTVLFLVSFMSIFYSFSNEAVKNETIQTVETLQFTPPSGWRNADQEVLPSHVKLMVVGKGDNEFPPSISLATETFAGSVKEYLKIVKKLNASKGYEWKDLGLLKTQAGNASLSQTDYRSNWGEVRMMHAILKKDGTIYILTAAASKKEFSKFYQEIFTSLRSLHFESN